MATIGRSGLFDISPRLTLAQGESTSSTSRPMLGRYSWPPHSLTVYDLLYQRTGRAHDQLVGFLLERSLSRVGRLVAISGQTQAAILRAWPELAAKVEVIPLECAPDRGPAPLVSTSLRLGEAPIRANEST